MQQVVAVVVTMRRPRELAALLASLASQDHPAGAVIVVENGADPETADVVARHPSARHVRSQANLGGAGGFALGILLALADGATHVWLMDDDGRPEDATCLDGLLAACDRYDADVVSPVIVDIERPSRLAFPYFIGGKRLTRTDEVANHPAIWNFAHLFNGALVRASAFARFGVPDYRLFLRGDEVDFLHRVRRGGGRLVSVGDVRFRHPSGESETLPILNGRLNAIVPQGELKRFYFFRNRGYLLKRHRLVRQAVSDLVRYPWYFLVSRRGDWRGLLEWGRLSLRGLLEDFRPFGK